MDRLLEDLENSFEELGVSVDKATLAKCVEICKQNNVLNAEEFVDAWMAYSISKLHGENPTVPFLIKFEKDEYGSKKSKETCHYQSGSKKSSFGTYEGNIKDVEMECTDLMKVYDGSSSKDSKTGSQPCTPEGSQRSRNKSTQQALFSPASFSPLTTSSSSKYNSRTNSGEVVSMYTNEEFNSSLDIEDRSVIKIECLNSVDIQRYMYFDLVDALDFADSRIDKIGRILLKKYDLEDPVPVRFRYPSPCVTIGRIACDADGRLNSKSVILEGSRELSSGEFVPVDLDGVEKYSIFPGQVVAIEGINLSGDKLIAKNIFYDASPEFPLSKPRGSFSMIVAAGPFTPSDSMTYQPLIDLIELTCADEPDFLILTGPFIDSNHPSIIENLLSETHMELFTKIVDLIMKPLQCKKTQVIMLSSYKDCNAVCIYPTPQLRSKENYQNLHLLPDPSLFDIDGTVIGITSTDILMHIGKDEVSSCAYTSDRLSRMANHILSQRSFYPLAPPAKVPIDPLYIGSAGLDIKPHILILPSDLRYFIKDVSGCVVVNPERLAKGLIGGTYARIHLDSSGLMGTITRI